MSGRSAGKRVSKPSVRIRGMRPTSEYPRNLARHSSLAFEDEESDSSHSDLDDYERAWRVKKEESRGESLDGAGTPDLNVSTTRYAGKKAIRESIPSLSPKDESDSDFPWPPVRQPDEHLPGTSVDPPAASRSPEPDDQDLKFTLYLLPVERAQALELQAKQAGDPFRFSIVDHSGDMSIAARSNDERSWEDLRGRVTIAFRRTWSSTLLENITRLWAVSFRLDTTTLRGRVGILLTFGAFIVLVVLPSWHRLSVDLSYLFCAIISGMSLLSSMINESLHAIVQSCLRRVLTFLKSLCDEDTLAAV